MTSAMLEEREMTDFHDTVKCMGVMLTQMHTYVQTHTHTRTHAHTHTHTHTNTHTPVTRVGAHASTVTASGVGGWLRCSMSK